MLQPITFSVRVKGWLRLLRLPNLFTVPGDPLAGVAAAVVAGSAMPSLRVMACCSAAALFLYAAGLVCNDICDYEHDMVCRPLRPLPSGQVGMLSAWGGMLLLGAAGLGLAFWAGRPVVVGALALMTCIVGYCAVSKSFPVSAAVVMGLCRGGSVMMGALAAGLPGWRREVPLVLALTMTFYVTALTLISRGEDRRVRHGGAAWFPALVLAAGGMTLAWCVWVWSPRPFSWWALGFPLGFLLAAGAAAVAGAALNRHENSRQATRQGVVRLIRILPVVQLAAMALVPPLQWAGLSFLFAAWAAGRVWGRKYPGS